MLYDCHMHSKWSGDSEAEPAGMIASAKEKGLAGITFTDHLDWDFAAIPHMFDLDIEGYLSSMQALASAFADDSFWIRTGLELGLQTHLAERHAKLLDGHSFDYVIGSIHQIDGEDPYYDGFWENKTYFDAYQSYFLTTLDNIEAFHSFDALGHLDYISRYGQRVAKQRTGDKTAGELHYRDFADLIDTLLLFLIRNDLALEVNTAPYRYGFDEPNPSRDILKRYHELGGRLLTIGADAHKPQDVAIGFSGLPDLLRECGFHSYFLYDKRKPVEVALA